MPEPQTHRRWTEDTGTAFLLALRQARQVRLAAAETTAALLILLDRAKLRIARDEFEAAEAAGLWGGAGVWDKSN